MRSNKYRSIRKFVDRTQEYDSRKIPQFNPVRFPAQFTKNLPEKVEIIAANSNKACPEAKSELNHKLQHVGKLDIPKLKFVTINEHFISSQADLHVTMTVAGLIAEFTIPQNQINQKELTLSRPFRSEQCNKAVEVYLRHGTLETDGSLQHAGTIHKPWLW